MAWFIVGLFLGYLWGLDDGKKDNGTGDDPGGPEAT